MDESSIPRPDLPQSLVDRVFGFCCKRIFQKRLIIDWHIFEIVPKFWENLRWWAFEKLDEVRIDLLNIFGEPTVNFVNDRTEKVRKRKFIRTIIGVIDFYAWEDIRFLKVRLKNFILEWAVRRLGEKALFLKQSKYSIRFFDEIDCRWFFFTKINDFPF